MPVNKHDSRWAFAFGAVFCVVLAYAALRQGATIDPYQFWLLRVIAAVAAAGVAAMVPGFIFVTMKVETRFALRAGGALAVFLIVYGLNPPDLVEREDCGSFVGTWRRGGDGFTLLIEREKDKTDQCALEVRSPTGKFDHVMHGTVKGSQLVGTLKRTRLEDNCVVYMNARFALEGKKLDVLHGIVDSVSGQCDIGPGFVESPRFDKVFH